MVTANPLLFVYKSQSISNSSWIHGTRTNQHSIRKGPHSNSSMNWIQTALYRFRWI